MKRWAAFLFLFISINLHSQKIITGIIKDAASKQPVSASIFLNNTSIGKNTGADGTFSLKIPPGKYDIIVSSVGYETYVTPAEKIIDSSFITILLKERVKELDAITLEPFEKNGWERWGKFFT
ncbi:MAG: carboxypeptidase-like regulatory protein, partial [Chitinophagaceae bacterium]|nr:carboxypeptidase-like regulatory protein [Chitinophagaceae bacterium]